MKTDAELRNPLPIHLLRPLGDPGWGSLKRVSEPERECDRQISSHRQKTNPARSTVTGTGSYPCENAGKKRDQDQPNQYHPNDSSIPQRVNRIMARNNTEPTASPDAYHRISPV